MKWFDSLFSDKKTHTSLKTDDDVSQNTSSKSYRDIQKRNPILSLARDVFDNRKSYTSFSLRKNIEYFCENFSIYIFSLTRRHWILMSLLFVLAYLVYGAGFIIRTERHVQIIQDNPGSLMTVEGFARLRLMREDYQIVSPLIQNPIFPLEPLATYGKVLNAGYYILSDLDVLGIIEEDVMQWREVSSKESIFPILDDIFSWISRIDDDVR